MKKVLKWSVLVAVVLMLGGFTGVKVGTYEADRKASRKVSVTVKGVPFVDDAAHRERGKYLFESRGCTDCHGDDAAGREFANDPNGFRVVGPNLTLGANTAVAGYTPADWERAIRHGVARDGRPLLIMPAQDYARMGDDDLAALVSYLRALMPLPGKKRVVDLPSVMKTLYAAGVIPDAAELIDHSLPVREPPPRAPTKEYGAYVAQMCTGCHGAGFSGGKIPGGPPDWPEAANLTPGEGGVMHRYPDAAALRAMFRSGKRLDGSAVNPAMPFNALGKLDDTDVSALSAYLATLAPRAQGGR